jgi:GDP-4-dehydro-6-deoxy-D-mannose reductase
MPRALITGFAGFVGKNLATHLDFLQWDVSGFDLRAPAEQEHIFAGEITDRAALIRALHSSKPEVIFHLAGMIKSEQPESFYKVHLLGTIALFEAIRESGLQPHVVVAGSGAVYGAGAGSMPINESFSPSPANHYAISKLVQEIAALQYFHDFKLPVMIVRMFNLIGPGLPADLACSAFARQIALFERTGGHEIVTGELNTRRDFVDVRDAVHAFALISEKGEAGQIYNVCSGQAVTIRMCLDEMISLSSQRFKIRVDPDRVQKNDVPVQIGDAEKLRSATGWRPQISLKQSLSDLLNDWRQRVKSELE